MPDEHLFGTRQDLSEMQTLGVASGPAVLVICAPKLHGQLRCDGELMLNRRPPPCSEPTLKAGSIRPGQRLADELSGIEVLCTVAGDGVLTFDGRELVPRAPLRQVGDRTTALFEAGQACDETFVRPVVLSDADAVRNLSDKTLARFQPANGDIPAVCIARIDGELYAVADACPHSGGQLSGGTLNGYVVTCPLHQLRFDIRTGKAMGNSSRRAKAYTVTLDDEQLVVAPRQARRLSFLSHLRRRYPQLIRAVHVQQALDLRRRYRGNQGRDYGRGRSS